MALTKKQLASSVVDKIRALNGRMAEDHFEMAKLLYTLHTGSLHTIFGYNNFQDFCFEELPVGYSTASKAVKLYADFKRLKYKKDEAIELIRRIGVTKARDALSELETKKSVAKIAKDYGYAGSGFSVNLDPDQMREVSKILLKHGLDVNENGRRMNMSETVVAAIKASA